MDERDEPTGPGAAGKGGADPAGADTRNTGTGGAGFRPGSDEGYGYQGGGYGRGGHGDGYAGGSGGGRYGGGYGRGFQSGGPSRVLDDLARLMTDVAGVAQGARREVETAMRAQAERFVSNLDLVSREEFEAVRDMAARARSENADLKKRLNALEAAAATPAEAAKATTARKPASKKAANPDA